MDWGERVLAIGVGGTFGTTLSSQAATCPALWLNTVTSADPSVVHLQRSRLFHRSAAAVSAAVMGFGLSRILCRPLSCVAHVAAVSFAHEWVDGLPFAADLLAMPAQGLRVSFYVSS